VGAERTAAPESRPMETTKPKRERIPQPDVLAWVASTHPALSASAHVERDWVWLAVDLRGDHNKPIRESIKEYGFRFAKRGHELGNGQTGTWAHACLKPLPFKRRGQDGRNGASGNGQPTEQTRDERDPLDLINSLIGA
jgi:hypothetical protein